MAHKMTVTAIRLFSRRLRLELLRTKGTESIAAGVAPALRRTVIAGARLRDGPLLIGGRLKEQGGMTVDMIVVAVALEEVMDWMTEGEVELCDIARFSAFFFKLLICLQF